MTTEPTDAEIEAAARAAVVQAGDPDEWDNLPSHKKRDWESISSHALAAALPLFEARLREQLAAEIEAEYHKIGDKEGATLEAEQRITAMCGGLWLAVGIVRHTP